MLNKVKDLILTLVLLISLQPILSNAVTDSNAATTEINSTSNNYSIIIEDDANLLTEVEEQQLRTEMGVLTEFGYVMFKTTNTANGTSSLRYIQNYYYSKLGNRSGVAFYIDMNKRQVCACATGGLEKIITSSKCDTIMDNVYRYATRGDYYSCAKETFSQMDRLLNGGRIAESMKYYCNAILSVMISLFISYGFYMIITGNRKVSKKDLIDECEVSLEHSPIEVAKTGTHRVYSPVSDSSSGGSFGGGSSGGGRRWIFWKRRKSRILNNIKKSQFDARYCFNKKGE